MNHQEAILALAKLNMLSKQIEGFINTDQTKRISELNPNLTRVQGWCKSLTTYMKSNFTDQLAKTINHINTTEKIEEGLKTKIFTSNEAKLLTGYVQSINNLKDRAIVIRHELKRQSPYPNLVDLFSNETAKKRFDVARNAGYLDDKYMSTGVHTYTQLKVLAWGIGQPLFPTGRFPWIQFDEQFGVGRISNSKVPEMRTDVIDDIKELFPDVDFTSLTAPKEEAYFIAPKDQKRIEELFLSLITHRYIDPRTSYANFLSIFGLELDDAKSKKKKDGKKVFKPVNWLKSQRDLTFFAYNVFGKKNKSLWIKVRRCFLFKGNTINKGGLYASFSELRKMDPQLDTHDMYVMSLAEAFNRKV